jgi:hypothetical protein
MVESQEWDGADEAPFDDALVDGDDLVADDEPAGQDAADDPLPASSFDASIEEFRFGNSFSEEIENVTASDWDVDADLLWGDAGSFDSGAEPDAAAFDFPA